MRLSLVLAQSASALCLATAAMADPITIYSPQGGERAEWIAEQAEVAGHEVSIGGCQPGVQRSMLATAL